jgi:hypothetical protein
MAADMEWQMAAVLCTAILQGAASGALAVGAAAALLLRILLGQGEPSRLRFGLPARVGPLCGLLINWLAAVASCMVAGGIEVSQPLLLHGIGTMAGPTGARSSTPWCDALDRTLIVVVGAG